MSKSTHFSGQPVFAQVLKLINRAKVEAISLEIPGSERYVKKLDGYTHLVTMLFGVLRHYDSLRELEIGLKAEVRKFQHLGIDYVAKRRLSPKRICDALKKFFAKVYSYLLKRYKGFLADSRAKGEEKEWERALYMMDSTTITLFDNILKGVGRHPKSGKKKVE